MNYRGHTIQFRYVGDGIELAYVVEHGDGLVGGRGGFASADLAQAGIDECIERRLRYCRGGQARSIG